MVWLSLTLSFTIVQKIRQELLSRQGSVDATHDSVSQLLQTADATAASGLKGELQELSQRYTSAQSKQTEREVELRELLPKLESFERLNADLRSFTQSHQRALSPVGQPDRSVEDYRQTIEVNVQLNHDYYLIDEKKLKDHSL